MFLMAAELFTLKRDFEQVSVAQLAQYADMSVGAVYEREGRRKISPVHWTKYMECLCWGSGHHPR
jgi:hypothetical protein